MKPRLSNLIGLLFSMTVLGGTSMAQEPADDLLAGPSVQDEVVTDEDMRKEKLFRSKDGMNRQEQGQMRTWLSTLQSLDLTQAQQTEVRTIIRSLHKAQEEFQKKHGEEVGELRKKSKEAKKNGNDIPDDVGNRTRELLAMAPDPTEYQSKAWVLLTEEQQTDFKEKYQIAVDKLSKEREKRMQRDVPMMDDVDQRRDHRQRDVDSDDRQIRVKQNHQRGDRQMVGDSTDQAAMRSIKFLRRLQRLRDQNQ